MTPMHIITTHKNTDFDALASAVAAALVYPGALPVIPRAVNHNVKRFLSIHKDVFNIHQVKDIDLNAVTRLTVVDVNVWNRLDQMGSLKEKKDLEIHVWDHHAIEGDIRADWVCQEEVGAAVTLLVRRLKEEKKTLTPIHSTLFLTGLYEDTGNLMFPSTRPEDARAAAYLLERKADLNVVGALLRPGYGAKQKDILYEMLKGARRSRIDGHNISIKRINISGHVDSLSVVVHMYREIMNVDAAFGIFNCTDADKVMVIGRSNIEGLNVGAVMRNLGGGGHPGAGSAMLKSVNPEAVENMLREMIRGTRLVSVRISDLMSFPVFSVAPSTTMDDAGRMLREMGCTGLPVVEDDRIVGVISRRDFKKMKQKKGGGAPVKAFMSTKVLSISPEKNPMHAVAVMVRHDIGRLPVVEDGKVVGIITRSDAMRYFYDLLPD